MYGFGLENEKKLSDLVYTDEVAFYESVEFAHLALDRLARVVVAFGV